MIVNESLLLVPHAQHPLESGTRPGIEFSARLDAAASAYWTQYEAVGDAPVIYVPGNRHRVGDANDILTLGEAGAQYLEDHHDIPRTNLHADDWNRAFGSRCHRPKKPGESSLPENEGAVYCGPDEAFAAVAALRLQRTVRGSQGGLEAFCSPRQVKRLSVSYRGAGLGSAEFAINPVDCGIDAHAGIEERLLTAYTHLDPGWRGPVRLLLRSRMPNDGGGPVSLPRNS